MPARARRARPTFQPPPPAPPEKCYKGHQVSIGNGSSRFEEPHWRPTLADVQATNTGSIRVIVQNFFDIPTLQDHNAYLQQFRQAGIFVICAIEQQGNLGQTAWQNRVINWVENIDADIYEIGNEPGSGFVYPSGTTPTNWAGFFLAVEHASAIVRGQHGQKMICGAPLDRDGNNFFQAAQNRSPAVSTFVDGFAIHPYGQSNPYNRTNSKNMTLSRLTTARNHIPQTKPLYITEMGIGVGPAGGDGSTLVVLDGSGTETAREREQGAWLSDIYATLWSRRFKTSVHPSGTNLYLHNIGWFWYRDKAPTPTQWWHYCGLRRADNTARALTGADPQRGSFTEYAAEVTFMNL